MEYGYRPPVYAKELKDVPVLYKDVHDWTVAFDVNKLPKRQMRVRMCCPSCGDKVKEEIWDVPGVFHVRIDRTIDKVVVVTLPFSIGFKGIDEIWELESKVLRKARKIDCNASFVPLDKSEEPKPRVTTNPVVIVKPPVTEISPAPPPLNIPPPWVWIDHRPTERPPVIGPFWVDLHRSDPSYLREREQVWLFYFVFFMLFGAMLLWK